MRDLGIWIRAQWDRVAAVLAVLGGLLALVLGWFGASGALLPAAQIPYVLSGGLVGIFLCGVGAALWLSADLRDEWRELHKIAAHLLATPSGRVGSPERLPGNEEES